MNRKKTPQDERCGILTEQNPSVQELIAAAAEALDYFSEDELEEYTARQPAEPARKKPSSVFSK